MKYLETKIDPHTKDSEIQVCIQCDLDTFDWLMWYIHSDKVVRFNPNEGKVESVDDEPLELNLSNIIKVLIPAEFLQIEDLREECIKYMGQNIEAITKMKINMNFLVNSTFTKLAEIIDIEVLDILRERKDKFITKLFDRKLQQLISVEE